MDPEPSLHDERTLDVELSALRERTEAMRLQASDALTHAHDALSHASELLRRSSRARARASWRRQCRLARLVEQTRPRGPNVVAFESQAVRDRAVEPNEADTRTGLDRAA